MKISKKEARLLIVLGGILLFVILYYVVNSRIVESKEAVEADMEALQPELAELETLYADRDKYLAETEAAKTYAKEQLAKYPADVRPQDVLVWTLGLEEAINFDIESVTFGEPELVSQFQAYATVDGEEILTDMEAYRTTSSSTGELSYLQLKSSIDYIYDTQDRTAIDSVSVSYNAESARLTGNFSVSKFYVTYPEAVYVESPMPSVPLGTQQPFGETVTGQAD